MKTPKTQVKRAPKRGHYDFDTVASILDEGLVCHVGFVVDQQPFVIPTAYGRVDDKVYIHGASASRMIKSLSAGLDVCLTVTLLDGLVFSALCLPSLNELSLGGAVWQGAGGSESSRENDGPKGVYRACDAGAMG